MSEPRDLGFSDPDIWPERHQRVLQEQRTRPERLLKLRTLVSELFPGEATELVRQKIETSFHVPQAGNHHNEGVFMDSHLEKNFGGLDCIVRGQFPSKIPSEVREMLTRVVTNSQNRDQLCRYVLLHDIVKANCLNITYREQYKQTISWETWQQSIPEEAQTDPVAMQAWLDAQGITSIGYYGHEEKVAATVAPNAAALGITPVVLKAIEKHGVAYNFRRIRLDTFQKHFGELSREEMEWVVTASYIDSSASLQPDGQPDLDEFLNLCGAIHNTFVIRALEEKYTLAEVSTADLDPRKVDRWLKQLRTMEEWITDTVDQLVERIQQECQFTRYDAERLAVQLQTGPLLPLQEDIMAALDAGSGRLNDGALRSVRQRLGKDNQLLTRALADSEIKK